MLASWADRPSWSKYIGQKTSIMIVESSQKKVVVARVEVRVGRRTSMKQRVERILLPSRKNM